MSFLVGSITTESTIDNTKFDKGLADIVFATKSIQKKIQSAFASTNTVLEKLTAERTKTASIGYDKSRKAAEEAYSKISSSAKKAYEKLKDGINDVRMDFHMFKKSVADSSIGKAFLKIQKTVTKVRDAINKMKKAFEKSLAGKVFTKAKANFAKISNAAKATLSAIKSIGKGMTIAFAIGAAAVYGVVRGVKALSNASEVYIKAMSNVATITSSSDGSITKASQSILGMNDAMGDATDMANGLYQAMSSGADNLKAGMDIVSASAIFGKAALVSVEDGVDILTTTLNAYGKKATEATYISDVFFKTIEEGKITGQQLTVSLGKAIPVFASVGISIEQLTGGLAAMTKVGVKTREATTQLNAMVKSFLKPSKAMKKALKEQGIESATTLMKTKGLTGMMDFLSTAAAGSSEKLAKLLPNTRALRGAMALAVNDGTLFRETLFEINGAAGSSKRAFEIQEKSFATLRTGINKTKIILGNVVNLLGHDFAIKIHGLTVKFREFITSSKGIEVLSAISASIKANFEALRIVFSSAVKSMDPNKWNGDKIRETMDKIVLSIVKMLVFIKNIPKQLKIVFNDIKMSMMEIQERISRPLSGSGAGNAKKNKETIESFKGFFAEQEKIIKDSNKAVTALRHGHQTREKATAIKEHKADIRRARADIKNLEEVKKSMMKDETVSFSDPARVKEYNKLAAETDALQAKIKESGSLVEEIEATQARVGNKMDATFKAYAASIFAGTMTIKQALEIQDEIYAKKKGITKEEIKENRRLNKIKLAGAIAERKAGEEAADAIDKLAKKKADDIKATIAALTTIKAWSDMATKAISAVFTIATNVMTASISKATSELAAETLAISEKITNTYDDEDKVLTIAQKNKLDTLKDSYTKGLIDEEEYYNGRKKLRDDFYEEDEGSTAKHGQTKEEYLDDETDSAYEALADQRKDSDEDYAETVAQAQEDFDNGLITAAEKALIEAEALALVNQEKTAAQLVFDTTMQDAQKVHDDWIVGRAEQRDIDLLAAEEEAADNKFALDTKNTKKLNAANKVQFEIDKALAVGNIALNTAMGVMSALKIGGLGAPMAVGIGILGGLEALAAVSGEFVPVDLPTRKKGGLTSGGLVQVNEDGGEIISLPDGSQVIPNDISQQIANNTTSNKNSTINVSFAGANIGNNMDLNKVVRTVSSKLGRKLATA